MATNKSQFRSYMFYCRWDAGGMWVAVVVVALALGVPPVSMSTFPLVLPSSSLFVPKKPYYLQLSQSTAATSPQAWCYTSPRRFSTGLSIYFYALRLSVGHDVLVIGHTVLFRAVNAEASRSRPSEHSWCSVSVASIIVQLVFNCISVWGAQSRQVSPRMRCRHGRTLGTWCDSCSWLLVSTYVRGNVDHLVDSNLGGEIEIFWFWKTQHCNFPKQLMLFWSSFEFCGLCCSSPLGYCPDI